MRVALPPCKLITAGQAEIRSKESISMVVPRKKGIIVSPPARIVHPSEREYHNTSTNLPVQWMHENRLVTAIFNGSTSVNFSVIFFVPCLMKTLGGFH
jgi:3-polyprenyl-4-hydroxybenzoate decarboxylase